MGPTFKEKALEVGAESIATLILPIGVSIVGMYQNKRITAVFLLAIVILAICAKYANTQPMHNFNNGLSHGYKVTAEFLRNKTHAILVGCTGGILYLLIGREIMNKIKQKAAFDNGWERGADAPFATQSDEVNFSVRKDKLVTEYTFNVKTLKGVTGQSYYEGNSV